MQARELEHDGLRIRSYGTAGPWAVVLHGGPAAPGYMAPVARRLAASFRVLEPFQRGSGGEPLTVARHVADLHGIVTECCGGTRPAIVGHSWGAMLALAYGAAHPDAVQALALVGCGTFDLAARARMRATLDERMDERVRRRLERLDEAIADPDERLRAMGSLIQRVDSYDLLPAADELAPCDARAHHETWDDMIRLQSEGVYPAAFAAIRAPVIMFHGAYDPHPGALIRAGLEPLLPQLEYRQWERCGHYPWRERAVHAEFLDALAAWLEARFAEA
ncbi:MAG: alpha/beta hydrolase [Candidatus Hydrogenedentes bacterium]|nr:alpha/beta hydrolase [Candidatus Hydrogenedentota bacterium]